MGQTDSKVKRLTQTQRKERDQIKQNTLTQRKQEIEKLQHQVMNGSQGKEVVPFREITSMLQIGETAKNQLDRGGGALTKSDLVAVLIALEPKFRKDIHTLNQLTNSDLNSMIRSIIYDPSRIFSSKPLDAIQSG
jgi:hypothetical protein